MKPLKGLTGPLRYTLKTRSSGTQIGVHFIQPRFTVHAEAHGGENEPAFPAENGIGGCICGKTSDAAGNEKPASHYGLPVYEKPPERLELSTCALRMQETLLRPFDDPPLGSSVHAGKPRKHREK